MVVGIPPLCHPNAIVLSLSLRLLLSLDDHQHRRRRRQGHVVLHDVDHRDQSKTQHHAQLACSVRLVRVVDGVGGS